MPLINTFMEHVIALVLLAKSTFIFWLITNSVGKLKILIEHLKESIKALGVSSVKMKNDL